MSNTEHVGADFLAEAVRLAVEGMRRGDGGPFGAVVVRAGAIVGRGWNRVLSEQDPTCHAEILAIRDACRALGRFHLEDCELYASCEPCPMCLAAVYWARVPVVTFASTRVDAAASGFADKHIYAELAKPLAARSVMFRHLPLPAAAAALGEWAAKTDKTPY